MKHIEELAELMIIEEIEQISRAKESFWEFCLYYDHDFFKGRESFLQTIAGSLQRIYEGKIKRYSASLPPRAGKSYIVTCYCAWVLGKKPEVSLMRNTHTANLADTFSNDVKGVIRSEKFVRIFGESKFLVDKVEQWRLETAKHGVSYFCGGVGGNVAGLGCREIAILDDSIKNVEQANSELQLGKIWDWYTGVHRARMEKGCAEVHIGTRWSNDDVIGRLEEEEGFFEEQTIIPALIDGETFCEAVMSTQEYMDTKRITADVIWEAEYMQNPIQLKGVLFPYIELNKFRGVLNKKPDGVIIVGDIADEGSDSLAVPCAFIYNTENAGVKVYIDDVVFTQEEIRVTQPLVAAFVSKYRPDKALFESNNGGKGFALEIKRLISSNIPVRWRLTKKNKHTRIIMKSAFVKEHFYFREDYENGSDYDKFMIEFVRYLKSGGSKHDDAADAITMLAEEIGRKVGVTFLT